MTVVDASVLVAYLHHADQFHQRSAAWMQQHLLAGEILVAPRLVLAEVAGAMARRTGDPAIGRDALQQLQALPELTLVPLTDQLVDAAALLAAELHLKGADAVYVAVAAQYRMPLVSWDQEQLERGALRILTGRPDNA